jgi:hypothetical protein
MVWRPTGAGEVCAPLIEGTEERLPDAEAIAEAADDDIRRNQDRRAARPAGAASAARAAGRPAHRRRQPDSRFLGIEACRPGCTTCHL